MIDLKDEARTRLRDLVRAEGPQVLADTGRLRGLMADRLPGYRREIALFSAAVDAGVPQRLRFQLATQVSAPWLAELASELATNTQSSSQPLSIDEALWSVNSWAFALGLIATPPEAGTVPTELRREAGTRHASEARPPRLTDRHLLAIAAAGVIVLLVVVGNLAGGSGSPPATFAPTVTPREAGPTPESTPPPENEPTPDATPLPGEGTTLLEEMMNSTNARVSACKAVEPEDSEVAAIECSVEGADFIRYGTYATELANVTPQALDTMHDEWRAFAESLDLLDEPKGRCRDNIPGEGSWHVAGELDEEVGRLLCFYDYDEDALLGARIDWTDERYAVWATIRALELDIAGIHAVWRDGLNLVR